jgi:hypothetical protein
MACTGVCYEMNGVMEYAPYSSWIKDIVAFHKCKRKFVSLKEMESEETSGLL